MVESPFNPIQMVEAYSEDDTPLPAGVNPSHYQHHRRHHRDHFDYDDVDEAEFEDGYRSKSNRIYSNQNLSIFLLGIF